MLAWIGVDGAVVGGVAVRQGVCDNVGGTRLVLNLEVKAEQLACPLMLWDHHQFLIQQEL
jgi:hypothetical protein